MSNPDDELVDGEPLEYVDVDQAEAINVLDKIHQLLAATTDETIRSILEDACFELSYLIDQGDELNDDEASETRAA